MLDTKTFAGHLHHQVWWRSLSMKSARNKVTRPDTLMFGALLQRIKVPHFLTEQLDIAQRRQDVILLSRKTRLLRYLSGGDIGRSLVITHEVLGQRSYSLGTLGASLTFTVLLVLIYHAVFSMEKASFNLLLDSQI